MTDGNGYYLELNDTKASTNPGSATTWGSTPTAPTSEDFFKEDKDIVWGENDVTWEFDKSELTRCNVPKKSFIHLK
mgnify:CR=1 FL=1